jgi:hypothetical protein
MDEDWHMFDKRQWFWDPNRIENNQNQLISHACLNSSEKRNNLLEITSNCL